MRPTARCSGSNGRPTPSTRRPRRRARRRTGTAPHANSILALSMETGHILWANQVRTQDNYIVGCDLVPAGPCEEGKACPKGPANCPSPVGPDVDGGAPASVLDGRRQGPVGRGHGRAVPDGERSRRGRRFARPRRRHDCRRPRLRKLRAAAASTASRATCCWCTACLEESVGRSASAAVSSYRR